MTNKTSSENKKRDLIRFLLVVLVVLSYVAFAIYKYGIAQGISVSALTWAFFVFATPVADAGFLLAFPIRLITGVRMYITQVVVWIFGVVLVGGFLLINPEAFNKTGLLRLFHDILTTPWPLWLILILSAVGTYLNVRFDDDVLDVATAKNKKSSLKTRWRKSALTIAVFGVTILLYIVLLRWTHTSISLL